MNPRPDRYPGWLRIMIALGGAALLWTLILNPAYRYWIYYAQ